ncbi:MAG: ATP-binding protein [Chloroflexota bacterium]
MNSLRVRLILSHVIPLMVTVPLIGIALVYLLESQILLTNLSSDLQRRATILAQTTVDQVNIWYDKDNAQAFVRRISSTLNTPVMLLDPAGDLLASSDPSDLERQGQELQLPGLDQALNGKPSIQLHYPRFLHPEFADILMPVLGPDGKVVGIIRLTDQLEGFQDRFIQLRTLVAVVLGIGLALGAIIGWSLAYGLERRLESTTQAISYLAEHSDSLNESRTDLPEDGPKEIRLLTRAFNTLAERLQTLEVSRRRLLANLVHELGRPLGALRSATEALRSGAHEDPLLRQELLDGMDGEINRLRRLLDDLSRLHNQALGLQDLNIQSFSLSAWIPGVLVPWRESAQSKSITWDVEISADLPFISADPDRLAQALGNLLSNAVKYTPSAGKIDIKTGVKSPASGIEKKEVYISVQNTGPFISPEERKRIFTPFYRGNTTTRFPQGMGLGLTIARDLVAAHGGRLGVEADTEKGNIFTIWLPINS